MTASWDFGWLGRFLKNAANSGKVSVLPLIQSPDCCQGVAMKPPSPVSLLLGLIPFIATCFSVSLWDRIHPFVLGLPFNIFWLVLWLLLSPLFMWAAYSIEVPRSGDRHGKGGAQ